MRVYAKPDPLKHCATCSRVLSRKRRNGRLEDMTLFLRRKYCDRRCMARGQEGMKVVNIQNSHRQSAKAVKSQCEICGKTKSEARLVVHHVDWNPLNNSAENLQTLCDSCHRLSHSPNYIRTPLRPMLCVHCSRPARRKGLCSTHLTRLRKFGDPLAKKVKIGSGWHLVRVDSRGLESRRWLMGLPPAFSSCADTAMQSWRQQQRSSSKRSSKQPKRQSMPRLTGGL